MKKLVVLCLITIIAHLALCAYAIYRHAPPAVSAPLHTKQFKIAILQPVSHPALDEIAQGFMETIQKSSAAQYTFTIYNANGNPSLLQAQAQEAALGDYDLLFTIASSPSKITKEIITKKQINKPLVFCAADDPVGTHLVASLESSGNNVTGVTVPDDYQKQIDVLLLVKPTIKKAVLVYDPAAGSGMATHKNHVEQLFASKGISMESIAVFNASEIQQKTAARIPHADVVIVLTDNTVVSGIDSLVKLCNQHGVLLFASDLNSGAKGAALAYGVREYDTGAESAKKAQLILEKNKKPTNIPVTPNNRYKLLLNRKTMAQQGLEINQLALLLATIGEVV